ncbi:MAG: methyltransferase [Legionellaceae bacterium]|nr:methyltransferase [Legionellaceae bacterium]
MVLDEQANYLALDDWFRTPQGQRVAEAFTSELIAVQDVLCGKRLIQLGSCGENSWLPGLRFRQKWLVSPISHGPSAHVFSSINALSIERNSVDCVIAPLTLEAYSRGKNPINEIDRILKPMGYAVFFGINPWSFWGAALSLGYVSCFANTTKVVLRSSLSLKHIMLQRGYQQCLLSSFYYIPPVKNEKMIHKLEFLNEMGKMIWPYPASFYCFIAQKYDPCIPSLQAERSGLSFARA